MQIRVASLTRVVGRFFGRARCLRGSVLQRQSDWACKHATTLYPRQGLGRWRCGGGNDGGGKPASPLPSRVTLFPRSRVSSTTDINISTLSNQSFFFFSIPSFSSSSSPPSPWDNTTEHGVYKRMKPELGSVRISPENRRDPRDPRLATRKETSLSLLARFYYLLIVSEREREIRDKKKSNRALAVTIFNFT